MKSIKETNYIEELIKDNEISTINKINPKDKDNFIIQSKLNQLTNEIWISLRNYPKFERNGLTLMIKTELVNMSALLNHGRYVKSTRNSDYKEFHYGVERLKSMIEISFNQKYIGLGFYKKLILEIEELGKMISTLLKNSSNKK